MAQVIFRSVWMKNFASVGNAGLKLELDKNPLTLLNSRNGVGKSFVTLDSICFGLYGRPYRRVNKPQLVNTINGKECVVEVELDVDNIRYKVVRGIKPNIFELYCNGDLIDQTAANKDYQQVLEQQILGMNYLTFTQICVMGPSNYVPFMRLKTQDRRNVIEELLDIRIFTTMLTLLKERVSKTKSNLDTLEIQISNTKKTLSFQEQMSAKAREGKDQQLLDLQTQLAASQKESEKIQEEIQQTTNKIADLSADDVNTLRSKLQELQLYDSHMSQKYSNLNDDVSFYDETEVCPTCQQGIGESHKEHMVGDLNKKKKQLEEGRFALKEKIDQLSERLEHAKAQSKILTQLNSHLSDLNICYKTTINREADIKIQIDRLDNDTTQVSHIDEQIRETAATLIRQLAEKKKWSKQKNVEDAIQFLLKDSGIKTGIIRQYLPTLNALINKYLEQLDLWVLWEMDEQFNEVLKSRYRENFTYDNFSEGEKGRIDIAILFAWRELARQRASIRTNLLVLDEILDKSIDQDGIGCLMNIFYSLENTNLFLISHNQTWGDRFPNTITLNKINNFTVIEE